MICTQHSSVMPTACVSKALDRPESFSAVTVISTVSSTHEHLPESGTSAQQLNAVTTQESAADCLYALAQSV